MTAALWRDRPTLVTGATGFLGGWVVSRLLDHGAQVVVLLRDEPPTSFVSLTGNLQRCAVVRGELADLSLLERSIGEYGIDTVFHLAAQSQVGVAHRGPYHTYEANVRGTYTLLEAARRARPMSAIVVASSDKAYGSHDSLPYTEDMELLGLNPYDASKAIADTMARSYAATYGTPTVVTRCGNLFGGGDLNWARLVPGTLRSLLRGERPVLRSDGSPIRDYLHVSDAADACLVLAERAKEVAGQAFNLSLERPVSVIEMVKRIADVAGRSADPILLNDAPGEIARQYLSAAKIRTIIGWKPRLSLEEGLAEAVDWYRHYLEAPSAFVADGAR